MLLHSEMHGSNIVDADRGCPKDINGHNESNESNDSNDRFIVKCMIYKEYENNIDESIDNVVDSNIYTRKIITKKDGYKMFMKSETRKLPRPSDWKLDKSNGYSYNQ